MATTFVDFTTLEGKASYSEKCYINYQFFKSLFGGSPGGFAPMMPFKQGKNWERMQSISQKFDQDMDYIVGTNLSDEWINQQSNYGALYEHLGCTSVALGPLIGQTLDLFTLELCAIRESDAIYITFPPYLCVIGLGQHIAMCTNHLFDKVNFSGTPVSHIRRSLLDQESLGGAIEFLKTLIPTTSVNFMLSDGQKAVDVEVTPNGVNLHQPHEYNKAIAHTNHVLNKPFHQDSSCIRLKAASTELLADASVSEALGHEDVVQPIVGNFGTIITVWIDQANKTLHYKDPGEASFKSLTL